MYPPRLTWSMVLNVIYDKSPIIKSALDSSGFTEIAQHCDKTVLLRY